MRNLKFRIWQPTGNYIYFGLSKGNSFTFETTPHIEQYTGIKDKNGKDIYEGDIVRWSYKVDRNATPTHTTDKVEWGTYEEEEWPYSTISGFTLPESEDGYEVIGNIHKNPELLGEQE